MVDQNTTKAKTKGKKIFFILGMHRTGSSFLSELLGNLGLQLPTLLLPPASDNERGFFEPLEIVLEHDRLLEKQGFYWDFVMRLTNQMTAELLEVKPSRLKNIFIENYPGSDSAIVKDPRLSLLLPLWKDVITDLELEDYYLLTFRNPISVAKSLHIRNRFSEEHACLLWLIYVLSSESNTRNKRRSFLHFPDWGVNVVDELDRVEQQLGTKFSTHNQQIDVSNVFVDKLVHQHSDYANRKPNSIQGFCFAVYEILIELQKNPNDPRAVAKLDSLVSKQDNLISVLCTQNTLLTTQNTLLSEKLTNFDGFCDTLNPSKEYFDPIHYLLLNKDVLDLGEDPFVHFKHFGEKEGRFTCYQVNATPPA